MCGIAGAIVYNGTLETSAIAPALTAMKHRGPDGNGIWSAADRSAILAHTRLAILGLDNGTQPIVNETGDVHIVVNGEFYGHEQIRTTLQAAGHRFKTDTDSEIALHLYEEYGTDCLRYLRGEFAFIIYDARSRQLFAARDRFGIKPLYYAIHQGRFYLASEVKALFAMGVPARWDNESYFHAASMQYTLPHRTLFAGVQQVQPGHYLISDGQAFKHYCYWDLNYETTELTGAEADVKDELSYLLNEAVRLRLRSDAPVCYHLSGGLDSSTIAALAAQHASAPLNCFTVSFEEDSYDELGVATEMASKLGARLHTVRMSQRQVIEHLPDAVYFAEGLAVNGHLPAKYLLHQQIAAAGFKVALTGEGSDEVFCGYAHLRDDLFTSKGRQELLVDLYQNNRASAGIMLRHGAALSLTSVQSKLGYVPSFLQAKASLGQKMHTILSDDLLSQYGSIDAYEELLHSINVEGQLAGKHPVYQSSYLWCKTALSNYILRTLGDGTELAHSVEGRTPFLDHVLFEYVKRIPLNLKINGTNEKYILKEAAKPYISATVYGKQKHPFVAPPVSTFSDAGCREMLYDLLSSSAAASVPFFNNRQLVAELEKVGKSSASESAAWDPVMMIALSTVALQQRFSLTEER